MLPPAVLAILSIRLPLPNLPEYRVIKMSSIKCFNDLMSFSLADDTLNKVSKSVDMIGLDLKTSNQIQTTYELQTAVYGQCYEECFGKKIDCYGILWLKSSKRKASAGKMQGKGWEVVESSRTFEENIDIFKTVKRLFDLENPTHSPTFTEFRTTAKREL